MEDDDQLIQESLTNTTKTQPMTYFLYPTLHASELKTFLEENKASGACVQKALEDVHVVNPNASCLTADTTETLSEGITNSLHNLAASDTSVSHVSVDSTNISLDWFEETLQVVRPSKNSLDDAGIEVNTGCSDCESVRDSKDFKNRSVKQGKKRNRFIEFLTTLLRQKRRQFMPSCMSSHSKHNDSIKYN